MFEQHVSSAIMAYLLLSLVFGVLAHILRCRHIWVESYYGLYADEPNGPVTWHGIRWTCTRCGKISSASGHCRH